jgi:hypothetical protein
MKFAGSLNALRPKQIVAAASLEHRGDILFSPLPIPLSALNENLP